MDQAALTGESLPVKKSKGEKAMMATTVTRGEAEAVVLATGDQTEVGMMNKLIANVDEPSHFETVLQQVPNPNPNPNSEP